MRVHATTGFFTLGVPPEQYDLPHPPLGLPVILFLRRVLLRAFEKLRDRGFPLATEREDRVTEQLFNVLENDLRQTGEIGSTPRFMIVLCGMLRSRTITARSWQRRLIYHSSSDMRVQNRVPWFPRRMPSLWSASLLVRTMLPEARIATMVSSDS